MGEPGRRTPSKQAWTSEVSQLLHALSPKSTHGSNGDGTQNSGIWHRNSIMRTMQEHLSQVRSCGAEAAWEAKVQRNKGQEKPRRKHGSALKWLQSPSTHSRTWKGLTTYPVPDTVSERLPHIFLPGISFSESQCFSHTSTLLSDSIHDLQALLVLTTHLDLFSSSIIHGSQLAQ